MHPLSILRYLCLSLLLSFFIVSCSNTGPEYNIGVSQCSQDEWREQQNLEMTIEASLNDNINLEIRSVNDDNQKQIDDIEYFIKSKKDLIIVSPNEAAAITPIVEKAYSMGIPVVVIDRKVDSDKFTAFVGADNRLIGRSVGNYVMMLASEHQNLRIYEVRGRPGATSASERYLGIHDVIDTLKNITFLGSFSANWKEDIAHAKMDSVLSKISDIDLVVAHNDRMAYGAYQAAQEHGLEDKIMVTGVDALTEEGYGVDMVMNHILKATFIYPTAGDKIMQVVMNILTDQPFEKETLLSSDVVDSHNARTILLMDRFNRDKVQTMQRLSSSIDVYLKQYNLQKLLIWSLGLIVVLFIIASSALVRLYWQQEQTNVMLESSTKAKVDFFTSISHDLRTPLTLMSEAVDTLKSSHNLDLQERKFVGSLNRNLSILLRLVNQTLDFRSFEEGKLALNLSRFDIRQSVSAWIETFVHVAKRKQIDLRLVISESMTSDADYDMIADEEKCERIIYNLLSNALRFTGEKGTVLLMVEPFRRNDRRWIRFVVKDDGIGIPKDKIGSIFKTFYQVDPGYLGSGLGLSLVKAFTEMHGGTVSVTSEENKGAEFIVEIPTDQPGKAVGERVSVDGEESTLQSRLIRSPLPIWKDLRTDRISSSLMTMRSFVVCSPEFSLHTTLSLRRVMEGVLLNKQEGLSLT